MEDFNTPREIRAKKQNTVVMIVATVLFIMYLLYRINDNPNNTLNNIRIIVVILMVFILLYMIFDVVTNLKKGTGIEDKLTLKLSPIGFMKGDKLYRWVDIECFGIENSLNDKTLYWKLKRDSLDRSFDNKLSKAIFGYDDKVGQWYEIDTGELAKTLNNWNNHHTGKSNDIETRKGLSRALSKREIVLVIGISIFIICALLFLGIYYEN